MSMAVRVEASPDGPVLVVGAALAPKVAALVRVYLEARPDHGARPDPDVLALHRAALDLDVLARAGLGYAGVTAGLAACSTAAVMTDRAAAALGIGQAAVRKRCRNGRMPGAQLVDGRWLIPIDALPTEGPDDDPAA